MIRSRRVFWMALLACAVPVAAGAQTPSPYDIFARARAFWSAQIYPSYLAYDVVVRIDEGSSPKTERYTSEYDATDNAIWVDSVSDYEIAHPVKVKGFNFGILGLVASKPLPPIDFLGVPMLAPTFSFGMAPFVPAAAAAGRDSARIVAAVRAQFHDPNPRTSPSTARSLPPGLHQIGSVTAFNRDYRVALLGIESIDGRPCYHLALAPLRDAKNYRLRELWVDQQTYATAQLREALNFVDGPGTSVPWTVRFVQAGGAQYIASETADAPMSYRGLLYRHASVAFEDLHRQSLPPPAMLVPPTSDLVMREPPTP